MEIPAKLGKYEVKRELGRGAMGVVFEGFDPGIQRRVALKTVKSDQLESLEADEILERFRREAQAAGRLTHANIVGVYEFGEDNGTVFIAMEFVEGKELKEYFDQDQRFPIAEVRRIMGEILDALDYSHRQGVVHRDIKPANIILLANGTAKVADFGIARLETSTLTQAGSVLGTPSYMSPEQFMGQTVDGRSDIFSAGVVLYQFLTGERPFTGAFTTIMHKVLKENPPLPSELNVQVPMAFDAVVRKALAKRPEERYQSAAEFRQAILAVQTGPVAVEATLVAGTASSSGLLPPVASANPPPPPSPPGLPPLFAGANAPQPKKSNAKLLGGMALVVVVLLIAAGVVAMQQKKSADAAGSSIASSQIAPSAATSNAAVSPAVASSGPGVTGSAAAAPSAPLAAPAVASIDSPPVDNGVAVITAMGVVDPDDSRYQHDPEALRKAVIEDARRQLIQKAAALYVEQSSLDQNYVVVRDKLLNRSGEYIKTVLDQQAPVLGADGLMSATLSASVNVRAVQKSLNQMSNDERIAFIRRNGDPKIAVNITATNATADGDTAPVESPVAENLLKDKIRSFGFRVVSDAAGTNQPDFFIDGQVHFKKLSAKLAASGLTIEKVVLTSWTVKATDKKTGEDIYTNTKIPQKQSWASEEMALQDIGQLIGDEFNKSFFLQYFQYPVEKTTFEISGLPATNGAALVKEMNGLSDVLNASLASSSASATVINASITANPAALAESVQGEILQPLNAKLGRRCFTVSAASETRVQIQFDASCGDAQTMGRLEQLPPAFLMSAPSLRRDDVVKNPTILKRMTV